MIRYIYFEDFTLPPIGWEVTNKQLLEDYQSKVMKDIKDGNFELDYTDDDGVNTIRGRVSKEGLTEEELRIAYNNYSDSHGQKEVITN